LPLLIRSGAERDWLVDTINLVLKREWVADSSQSYGTVETNVSRGLFDPLQIVAGSPVVIDDHRGEELRCHFTSNRGAAIWVLAAIGLGRRVETSAIDAITTLAYANRELAARIKERQQAPDAELMNGCVVRYGGAHLVLSIDKQVDPILQSLLRGKLAEWGRTVGDV